MMERWEGGKEGGRERGREGGREGERENDGEKGGRIGEMNARGNEGKHKGRKSIAARKRSNAVCRIQVMDTKYTAGTSALNRQ